MAATAKKNAKKPAAKAATKRSTAKKKPTKAAAVSASSSKPAINRPVTLESLYKLHIISAVISAVSALISALLLLPSTTQLVINYLTVDSLASADKVVLAPAARVVWEVELRYLLAGIFVIAAIGSLLLATILRKRYENTVANQTSGFRWLFVGISSALLLEFASILGGVQDLATLKLIAALVLVTSLLSWLAERENKGAANPKWLAYSFALVAGALAWVPLATSMVATPLYGMERFSWYVYAFAGVLLLGFIGFALTLSRQIRVGKASGGYLSAESSYLSIDLAMKVAAIAVIFAALKS